MSSKQEQFEQDRLQQEIAAYFVPGTTEDHTRNFLEDALADVQRLAELDDQAVRAFFDGEDWSLVEDGDAREAAQGVATWLEKCVAESIHNEQVERSARAL